MSANGMDRPFSWLQIAGATKLGSTRHGMIAPPQYDDGGYSGVTLDRPALQRLLADMRGSKVDVVAVYKIDRLTRSLLDFAKINP
jgi:DNA invertase Pin-like site-specific DNA recombinase